MKNKHMNNLEFDNNYYTLGFLFSEDKKSVVLIEKTKPEWQKGLLNGVGGKIEELEMPNYTIVREFKEETKATTFLSDWTLFANMIGEDFHVACYVAFNQKAFDDAKTNTEEKVYKVKIKDLDFSKCVSNLSWLIPMALDENYGKRKFATILY